MYVWIICLIMISFILDYNDKIHCFEVNSLRMLKPYLGFTSGFSTSLYFSCVRYNWIIYLDRGSVWSFWFIEIFFVLSIFYKSNLVSRMKKKRSKLDRKIFFVNGLIICKLLLEKTCSRKQSYLFLIFYFINTLLCLNLSKFVIVT